MLCGLSRPVASFEVGAAPLRKNLSWVQDPSKSRKTAQAMWTTCISIGQSFQECSNLSWRAGLSVGSVRLTRVASPGRPRRRASQAAALKTCRDLGADGAGGWTCRVVLKANQRGSNTFFGAPPISTHAHIRALGIAGSSFAMLSRPGPR